MFHGLIADRGADLSILVRKRFDLADVLIQRIAAHGRAQIRATADLLIQGSGSQSRLTTDLEHAFVIEESAYAPYDLYTGAFSFAKHAFSSVAAMGTAAKPDGEEAQCAQRIDTHTNVRRWLRNLTHGESAFFLPLSPGRFYPDFLAELNDGRIAVIEYKGANLAHAPAEQHKKAVGELWAGQSGGKAVFVWVQNCDWPALQRGLSAAP